MKRHTSQNSKQRLGQYFTSSADTLLCSFTSYVSGREVVDPFAGGGDLLRWAQSHGAASTVGYDIDPSAPFPTRDSLLSPPTDGDFIVTNPPYLSRNKAKGAYTNIFNQYKQNDLYKCFLASLTHDSGIVIIPSNFLSESSGAARKMFFSQYTIEYAEYWTEPTFADATTGVVIFAFRRLKFGESVITFDIKVMPEARTLTITLAPEYEYLPGKDFFDYIHGAPALNIRKGTAECPPNTQLVLGLLDRGKYPQGLSIQTGAPLLSNGKAFTTVQLWIEGGENLSIEEQIILAHHFNETLRYFREKYAGLFLTNYMGANQKILPISYCYRLLSRIIESHQRSGPHTFSAVYY